ncbi:MAG TPA: prolipoprotein diacylglyceryl transferase family protein [Puia sp.]|jgi:prolipoprotein diacylglyceryltransferase|nr:prolipoprotein diacylglyceryl transferase family protein [Puia sp.]
MVSLHILFETLGMAVGFRYFVLLRKRQPDRINDTNRIWIIIGAAFGAFVFSRLVGALENPVNLLHTKHVLLYLYANKTIVGALLGGLLMVEITKKIIQERSSSGDLFTYPLILAIMIGRIGCFTSGMEEETYGLPTHFVFGMNLGDGVPRHPVTLYEIAFLGLLWVGLAAIERRVKLKNGYRFQFFMIAYFVFRFLLDFIKPRYVVYAGLGMIQLCCLAGLLYYSRTIYKIFFNFSQLTERHEEGLTEAGRGVNGDGGRGAGREAERGADGEAGLMESFEK